MGKKSRLSETFTVVGSIVLLFWVIEIVDKAFFRGHLDAFGIRPRQLAGLAGIVFAPFLHGGFTHLIANTFPFLILGGMVYWRRPADFFPASVLSALIGGLGAWVLGAPGSVHVGASSIIFGYFGFLVARAWYDRDLKSTFLAFLAILLYGGIIWGIRPFQTGISWQGHLFGLIGGIYAAKLRSQRK